ncbi:MAG TPA: uracil phosphoribosyltransferase [Miltoncostaeales bacterium]|jgi:uracil phosphoribosyltransferase|nr:uracil phosphoribosyltransferase [Miltoncostaeales bacterium]
MSGPVRQLGGALAGEHIARLRDKDTPPAAFRTAAGALSTLVLADALADLEGARSSVETPLETTDALRPARRVTLVPVLRAGLALMEPALRLLPGDTRVGFLGMARDEHTLQPTFYLERLPSDIGDDDVVVLDVMLATGGSAVAALDAVVAAGAPIARVRFACLIAAPEGVARIHEAHPTVPITAGVVDRELNGNGFITPGLGDAGDRLYGATE